MKFSKSIIEIIRERSSWRTYSSHPIDPRVKDQLIRIVKTKRQSPIGGNARFELIQLPEVDSNERKKLGTYGVIKGAQHFIVGAMQESDYNLENFGYLMEELILYAADFGLGTCWLGGTFKRSNFAAQINATEVEQVPAITPVGYPAKKRSVIDKLFKWGAKSKTRRPWGVLFFKGDINHPLTQDIAETYTIPLEMVRIAPSAGNKQPWRIIKDKEQHYYHFYRLKGRRKRRHQFLDLSRIDMGIAMNHFALTVKELGIKGRWQINNPNQSIPDQFEYLISWSGE